MAAAVMAISSGAAGGSGGRSAKMSISEDLFSIIDRAFSGLDVDGSRSLSKPEMFMLWRMIFPRMTDTEVQVLADEIYEDLDPNHDGHVMWYEMEKFFKGGTGGVMCDPTEVDLMLTEHIEDRAPTCREATWAAFSAGDSPTYTDPPRGLRAASLSCAIISNLAIIMSIGNFVAESLPERHVIGDVDRGGPEFIMEASCIGIFSFEFIVRLAVCPNRARFFGSFFTWVDVLAILPFYIGILANIEAGPLVVLRVLRLLRLLRMLKLGKRFEAVQVLIISIGRTIGPLAVSMFGINVVAITLFGSLVASAERQGASFDQDLRRWVRDNSSSYADAGQVIQFQSVPVAMWWAWVTLTTVGYGDMYPSTGPGMAVASLTMAFGLVLMAFPLTLMASAFADVDQELCRKKVAKARSEKFRRQLEEESADPREVDKHIDELLMNKQVKVQGLVTTVTGLDAADGAAKPATPAAAEAPSANPLAAGVHMHYLGGVRCRAAPEPAHHPLPGDAAKVGAPCAGAAPAADAVPLALAELAAKLSTVCEAIPQLCAAVARQERMLDDVRQAVRAAQLLPPLPPHGADAAAAGGDAPARRRRRRQQHGADGAAPSLRDSSPTCPSTQHTRPSSPGSMTQSLLPGGMTNAEHRFERLTYISHRRAGFGRDEISAMVAQARARNSAISVSGFLVYADPFFFQTIEGSPVSIAALWKSIRRDLRHDDVEVVERVRVGARLHSIWDMEAVEISAPSERSAQPLAKGGSPQDGPPLLSREWLLSEMMTHVHTSHVPAAAECPSPTAALASSIAPPADFSVRSF